LTFKNFPEIAASDTILGVELEFPFKISVEQHVYVIVQVVGRFTRCIHRRRLAASTAKNDDTTRAVAFRVFVDRFLTRINIAKTKLTILKLRGRRSNAYKANDFSITSHRRASFVTNSPSGAYRKRK